MNGKTLGSSVAVSPMVAPTSTPEPMKTIYASADNLSLSMRIVYKIRRLEDGLHGTQDAEKVAKEEPMPSSLDAIIHETGCTLGLTEAKLESILYRLGIDY